MSTRAKDLVGKRFGLLTVVSRAGNTKHGSALWNCLCDCGGTKVSATIALTKHGDRASCGCAPIKRKAFLYRLRPGDRVGRRTVIRLWYEKTRCRIDWKCDCGNVGTLVGHTKFLKSKRCPKCPANIDDREKHPERYDRPVPWDWYNILKTKARVRGLVFKCSHQDLNELWEKQGGLCALSGVPITLEPDRDTQRTDYLGRKDLKSGSLDRLDSNKGYVNGNLQFVHKIVNLMKLKMRDEEFVGWCKKIVDYAQVSP